MSFETIHTNYGLSALAAAEAAGTTINLSAMAIGDGGGNPTTPDPTQTALVREVYRASLNRVYRDPGNATQYIVEFVVPASVGGFVMRECGVYDSNGNLYALANTPDMYKPTTADGAYADTVIRLVFRSDNASVVNVVVDPNVAVATQSWIANNVTVTTILPGGTYHQVLRKKSNTSGDVEWADPTDVNVVVSIVEETQTLAAGQTVVNLTVCNTNGLALYESGLRLRAVDWTPDPIVTTRLTLATAYPAGTQLICVQNEPAHTTPNPLTQQNNLSDLTDVVAARSNLGVLSAAQSNALMPAGMVSYFAGAAAPAGYLIANGAPVSRTTYANLFNQIGVLYGVGDGFTTFNLPSLCGMFIRGADMGRGVDLGRVLGTTQDDAIKTHQHAIGADDQLRNFGWVDVGLPHFNYDARSSTAGGDAAAVRTQNDPAYPLANETRPKNVALLPCIKY